MVKVQVESVSRGVFYISFIPLLPHLWAQGSLREGLGAALCQPSPNLLTKAALIQGREQVARDLCQTWGS